MNDDGVFSGIGGMNVGAMGPIAKKVIYLIPPVMFFFMKDFPAVSAPLTRLLKGG